MDRSASTPRAGLTLRWARAVLLSAVVLGGGLVAHASAGGLLPGTTALLILYAATAAGTAALLGRPASTRRVVVLVAGGQLLVHGVLTALAGHRGDPPLRTAAVPAPVPVAGTRGRVGSYYDLAYAGAHPAAAGPAVPAPVQHLLADLTGPHALMGLAHLAAAVLVGLWLAVGERALWTVLAALAGAFVPTGPTGTGFAGLPRTGPSLHHRTLLPRPRLAELAVVVGRRGPPAYA